MSADPGSEPIPTSLWYGAQPPGLTRLHRLLDAVDPKSPNEEVDAYVKSMMDAINLMDHYEGTVIPGSATAKVVTRTRERLLSWLAEFAVPTGRAWAHLSEETRSTAVVLAAIS